MTRGNRKRGAGRRRDERSTRQRRLRVLIAASVPGSAASLEKSLEHSDFELIGYSVDAMQLESVLRDTDPDVLVLDLEDEAAELDTAARITTGLSSEMPVVAVGNTSGEWIGRALRYGIRGLLPQTASVEELASAVRAVAAGLLVISPEFGDVMLSQSNTAEAEESEVAIEALTPREQQVLAMLSEGLLNKEIADRMQISEHTVKFHISSIMGKLGASSRTEAVTRGIRRGLVFV